MKRIITISALIVVTGAAFFMESCSKSNPVTPSVSIASVKPSNPLAVYPANGDTIIITGSGFGSSGTVIFNPSVSVSSSSCIEWTDAEIQVIVPQTATAGNMYVTTGGNNSNLFNLDILWPHYSGANGLADTIVSSIAIDHQNNAWIGTDKGLSKFDGANWTTYTTQNGLPSNNIHCVACDRQGNIWVGSDNGLSKFNGANWVTYTSTDGLVHDDVQAVAFDSAGNAWIGTYNGVSQFDGTNWTSYQYSDTTSNSLIHNNVISVSVDKRGHKWFGTLGFGVDEFYQNTDTTVLWHQYLWPGNYEPYEKAFCVGTDSVGIVWIGTFTDGVSRYDGNSWVTYTKPNSGNNGLADYSVPALTFDSQNNKWFGTYNGISKFDGTNWTTYSTDNGLTNNFITALAFDKNGYLWVGTNGGGASHCNFRQ